MNGSIAPVENKKEVVLRVAVGSTNPSKLLAVRQALEKAVVNRKGIDEPIVVLEIKGFDVASDVPDQPMGDSETRLGAQNRARAAYNSYKNKFGTLAHFGIGCEGGLEGLPVVVEDDDGGTFDDDDQSEESHLWCMAWMAIYGKRQTFLADLVASPESKYYYADKKPVFGLAKTAAFMLPPSISKLCDKMELGAADDYILGRTNSKCGSGTVGKLTDGIIDRSAYYEHALILALVPWIRPDVYPSGIV
jgi:non-canonical (house-cleaning) NTP pyrophosphatase